MKGQVNTNNKKVSYKNSKKKNKTLEKFKKKQRYLKMTIRSMNK